MGSQKVLVRVVLAVALASAPHAEQSPWWPGFTLVSAAAVALAQVNLVRVTPLRAALRWLKPLTVLAGLAAVALNAAWMVQVEAIDFEGPLIRSATAAGIIGGAMTLAVFVLAWVTRVSPQQQRVFLDAARLTVTCPECGVAQRIGPGRTACVNCGLLFHLQVEEPHCPGCHYLLYHAHGDRCPECGMPIAFVRGVAVESDDVRPSV